MGGLHDLKDGVTSEEIDRRDERNLTMAKDFSNANAKDSREYTDRRFTEVMTVIDQRLAHDKRNFQQMLVDSGAVYQIKLDHMAETFRKELEHMTKVFSAAQSQMLEQSKEQSAKVDKLGTKANIFMGGLVAVHLVLQFLLPHIGSFKQ